MAMIKRAWAASGLTLWDCLLFLNGAVWFGFVWAVR